MRLISLIILISLLPGLHAHAISFVSTNTYTVAEDQTVAGELWIATSDMANTKGTFKSDLFIASGTDLLLNGTYEGSVWGAGNTGANMGGTCLGSLRLAGKTVRIAGRVEENVMALADTVIVASNTVVHGGMKLLGQSIILEGRTRGDVSITASRVVTLGGTIDGNVEIIAPDILFTRDTHIAGNLTYTAGKELVPAQGVVAGKLERIIPPAKPGLSAARLVSHFMWFIAALFAGIPFISLFPMTTAISSQLVRTSPWKCLWAGALCVLALPVFAIMSISSIIGIPLGLLLLGSWGFMVYTSRIIMGLLIGTLVLRKSSTSIGHVLLSMVTGLGIIYSATAIPAISWPVQITVTSMGTGALLLGLFHKRRLIIQVPQELKQLEELKKQQPKPEEEQP